MLVDMVEDDDEGKCLKTEVLVTSNNIWDE